MANPSLPRALLAAVAAVAVLGATSALIGAAGI